MPYDIAVNIADAQYVGKRRGIETHPCDIADVINRAQKYNVHMVFLGTAYKDTVESIALAEHYGEYATAGIHPVSARWCTDDEIKKVQSIVENRTIAGHKHVIRRRIAQITETKTHTADTSKNKTDRIVAVGEIGLDYYRDSENKTKQKRVFRSMLETAQKISMPCILHYRACADDFLDIAADYKVAGVIHSYTDSMEEAKELLNKGYYIGINGLSIRQSIHTGVVQEIPLDRLLVETDAPYCAVKHTDAYYDMTKEYIGTGRKWSKDTGVRGRNEPANVHQVLDIVAKIRGISKEELVQITDVNARKLLGV